MPIDSGQSRVERLNKLRKLGVRRGAHNLVRAPEPVASVNREEVRDAGQAVLPGGPVDTPFGPAWVRTVRHDLAEYPHLAEFLAVRSEALAALGRDRSLEKLDPAGSVFLDTETTGLSLGVGTYTFMIGLGTYEPGAFVVRQYFMRNPGEERAQLHLVQEALAGCSSIVSFNGRAFDLPLLYNRFILARMPLPLRGGPHLDLLPPARRIWRARLGSCSLGNLELNILGVRRTIEDVPGWLIPEIYRQYYSTGLASELLARVFYHNLQDITSMPLLAAHMARFFLTGASVTASPAEIPSLDRPLHPLESVSLARCYLALDWPETSIAAYRTGLSGSLLDADRRQALSELGSLFKRLKRREEAAALWEEWISTLPGDDYLPYVELAKHHEWFTMNLAAARGWTAWALRIVEAWSPGFARDEALAELHHRLARLERKLTGGSPEEG